MGFTVNYKDKARLKVFDDKARLAESFTSYFIEKINSSIERRKDFNVALSGGSTPSRIYAYMKENLEILPSMHHVHFFWGDERAVPPENQESNFGNAWRDILRFLEMPEENIHRIKAEEDPGIECRRYSNELTRLPLQNELPFFDLIILGIGEDGHTASIFPDRMDLLTAESLVEVAKHPGSGQLRFTFTGPVLNNAGEIIFLATGKSKRKVIGDIFSDHPDAAKYPAYHIWPEFGSIKWYVDREAGEL